MSLMMNSIDDDTITISSSIFPFDNDFGVVSFSQTDNENCASETDRLLSSGCAEESYEQPAIIAEQLSNSDKKFESYSSDELFKELIRRGQLTPTNVFGIWESDVKGNIGRRDQLTVGSDSEYKEVEDSFVNEASCDEGIGSNIR